MSHQGNRLRLGRYSEAGRSYLVSTVTRGRVPLFTDWRIGRLIVRELQAVENQGMVRSVAWIVMPDHLHWLFELQSADLSAVVRRVKGRSARAVNGALDASGSVWQRGFHDRAIRKDEDLKMIARYVLRNAIEAGLVKRIGDYPLWDACWI